MFEFFSNTVAQARPHVTQVLPRDFLLMSVGRKRRELTRDQSLQISAAINANLAIDTVINAFRDLGGGVDTGSLQWQRKLAAQELYRVANTETPYGKVCQITTVAAKCGDLDIYHVSPFALLSHAVGVSELFANFIRSLINATPDGALDLVFYLDKAVPGNIKRPDLARSTQCVYWSCAQFPAWFRSRRCGWIPFAYVLAKDQKAVSLTDSMLVRFIVRVFNGEGNVLTMREGFAVHCHDGILRITCRTRLTVADWEQHIKTFNLLGYNACVPCGICRNVLGRCPYFVDPYLVHVDSHEYARFDKHTTASLFEVCDRVKHIAETESAARLKAEEKATGIKYDPDGLMWDTHVRGIMNPPLCEGPDWMHTYAASGGVGQYEVIRDLVSSRSLRLCE